MGIKLEQSSASIRQDRAAAEGGRMTAGAAAEFAGARPKSEGFLDPEAEFFLDETGRELLLEAIRPPKEREPEPETGTEAAETAADSSTDKAVLTESARTSSWTLEADAAEWDALLNWIRFPAPGEDMAKQMERLGKLYLSLQNLILKQSAGAQTKLQLERLDRALSAVLNRLVHASLPDTESFFSQYGEAHLNAALHRSALYLVSGRTASEQEIEQFWDKGRGGVFTDAKNLPAGGSGGLSGNGRAAGGGFFGSGGTSGSGGLSGNGVPVWSGELSGNGRASGDGGFFKNGGSGRNENSAGGGGSARAANLGPEVQKGALRAFGAAPDGQARTDFPEKAARLSGLAEKRGEPSGRFPAAARSSSSGARFPDAAKIPPENRSPAHRAYLDQMQSAKTPLAGRGMASNSVPAAAASLPDSVYSPGDLSAAERFFHYLAGGGDLFQNREFQPQSEELLGLAQALMTIKGQRFSGLRSVRDAMGIAVRTILERLVDRNMQRAQLALSRQFGPGRFERKAVSDAYYSVMKQYMKNQDMREALEFGLKYALDAGDKKGQAASQKTSGNLGETGAGDRPDGGPRREDGVERQRIRKFFEKDLRNCSRSLERRPGPDYRNLFALGPWGIAWNFWPGAAAGKGFLWAVAIFVGAVLLFALFTA